MATVTANAMVSRRHRSVTIAPALAVAAMASIGAGVIHAAAIGVHSEHRQAVITFTVVAAVQLAWGIGALLTSNRWVVLAGAAANTAAFVGWVMAKTSGISFIDGFDVAEGVQFADFAAAMLAAVAVIGAIAAVLQKGAPDQPRAAVARDRRGGRHPDHRARDGLRREPQPRARRGGSRARRQRRGSQPRRRRCRRRAVAPAVATPTRSRSRPRSTTRRSRSTSSGVDGVTPEQQARAENLIAITLLRLPQWSDYHTAEAAGFVSIGDGDHRARALHQRRLLRPTAASSTPTTRSRWSTSRTRTAPRSSSRRCSCSTRTRR